MKLTNEIIDMRLGSRPVVRLGNTVNSSTKLEWKCLICIHIWSTTPNSVLNLNSGCPRCAGTQKYTNIDIDLKLGNRLITRVSEYVDFDTPITWKCSICLNQWEASPNNVITKITGCPKCSSKAAGLMKSQRNYRRVINVLESQHIQLLSPYTRVKDVHTVECKTCAHVWHVRLNDIVNKAYGCPSCVGLVKLTNSAIDDRLIGRDVTRVGDVKNASTKLRWRCPYNHAWEATPDSVLNLLSGCPLCNSAGFASKSYFARNPHKKDVSGLLYMIEGIYNDVRFVKIGITERTVIRRFGGNIHTYQIKEIASRQLALYDAYLLEQEILKKYAVDWYQPSDTFGGKTECIRYDEHIVKEILRCYFSA